jgi:hypothetical protein
MKTQTIKRKRGPYFFGLLGALCLSLCFIFGPLGSFVIWISGGTAIFCFFMMIYLLIPIAPAKYSKKKMDPKEVERRAYIAYHLPLVISVLLGGLLIAVIVIFFAA